MYIFDENDEFYRSPCTPIEVPGTLTLKLKTKHCEAMNPRVLLYHDDVTLSAVTDEEKAALRDCRSIPMSIISVDGDYDVYSVELSFEEPGLYWYYFLIDTLYGDVLRTPEHHGGAYQITVYKQDEYWPDWIEGGLIYHIFVDRFNGDGKIRVRPGAVYRADWGGCPYFLPDERGIVKNNDFFGGNLYGIAEKLPYLDELGVTCIYLSPIFDAESNHKYDTGNFMKIDEMFGGDEALDYLISKADDYGMKIILDGVFNHVGSSSVYFNRYGRYDSIGAYQDRKKSPYRDWFTFHDDGKYDSWWGIELLPAVKKDSPSYKEFLCGRDGVIAHWTSRGVAGWRLDVVDEIPDVLLDPMCEAMRREKKDVFIAGEVWEDASYKIAYSERRRYFLGGQLHSVTNYPLKDAIICFVKDKNTDKLATVMADLCRNYPKKVLDSLMNIIGTHDTARILTALSDATFPEGKFAMSHVRLSEDERTVAKMRLRLAAALQFTLPGVPCVYYGDEAGMEGCIDPFNRVCYPWGNEDKDLVSWYKTLSSIRKNNSCFVSGIYKLIQAQDGLFAFTRGQGKERVLIAVNAADEDKTLSMKTKSKSAACYDLLGNKQVKTQDYNISLQIKSNEVGIYLC